MNQPNLNIEILAVPQPIKEKLRDLSQIVFDAKRSVYFAEKDKGAGWRKDNTLLTNTISELVPEIENRFK